MTVEEAKAKMEAAYELAKPVILTNHPLALAWDRAYYDWLRARWDDGDRWVRSVWLERPTEFESE